MLSTESYNVLLYVPATGGLRLNMMWIQRTTTAILGYGSPHTATVPSVFYPQDGASINNTEVFWEWLMVHRMKGTCDKLPVSLTSMQDVSLSLEPHDMATAVLY